MLKMKFWLVAVVLVSLAVAGGVGFGLGKFLPFFNKASQSHPAETTQAPASAFVNEVFALIKDQYWEGIDETKLVELFTLAIDRVYGPQPELQEKTQAGLIAKIDELIKLHSDQNHAELAASVCDLVLRNLQPADRSMIYSEQAATQLNQRVANVDPKTDLFATLDVTKDASSGAITQAYEQKRTAVEKSATDSASKTQELAQLDRAYGTVGDQANKERYIENKVEPTIFGKTLSDQVYYVKIKQFSPTTVEDLDQILKKLPTATQGSSLIIDLRGNFGGAIDGLPYLLGPFIGPNQYAYQFFSKGQAHDFKTKTAKLESLQKYKKMVILIDGQTQSSAEVMAATFKKYRVGVLVGGKTKGWGTVERVFPITHQPADNVKYSVFLVHNITLDENGQPIEGKGVIPDVDIANSSWPNELNAYFTDQDLIKAVKELVL